MKKLKLLFAVALIMVLLYSLHFASYIFMHDYWIGLVESTSNNIVLGIWNYIISGILELIMFIAVVFGLRSIWIIIKKGYYTNQVKKAMNIMGWLLIVSGVLSLVMDVIRLTSNAKPEFIINPILFNCLLTIFGLAILIISDMVTIRFKLKQENDLTI